MEQFSQGFDADVGGTALKSGYLAVQGFWRTWLCTVPHGPCMGLLLVDNAVDLVWYCMTTDGLRSKFWVVDSILEKSRGTIGLRLAPW